MLYEKPENQPLAEACNLQILSDLVQILVIQTKTEDVFLPWEICIC